jgi:hypothetical protein
VPKTSRSRSQTQNGWKFKSAAAGRGRHSRAPSLKSRHGTEGLPVRGPGLQASGLSWAFVGRVPPCGFRWFLKRSEIRLTPKCPNSSADWKSAIRQVGEVHAGKHPKPVVQNRGSKSEIRDPKEIRRPKSEGSRLPRDWTSDCETVNPAKSKHRRLSEIRASDFGLLSDLGIRVRISTRESSLSCIKLGFRGCTSPS